MACEQVKSVRSSTWSSYSTGVRYVKRGTIVRVLGMRRPIKTILTPYLLGPGVPSPAGSCRYWPGIATVRRRCAGRRVRTIAKLPNLLLDGHKVATRELLAAAVSYLEVLEMLRNTALPTMDFERASLETPSPEPSRGPV